MIEFTVPLVKILLVLVILTAALITSIADLLSMISIYSLQSFLIALVALVLYASEARLTLIFIAIITLVSKVFLIPHIIKRIQKKLEIKRDVEFHFLSPISAIFTSCIVFFLVYTTLARIVGGSESKLFLTAASLSIVLVFVGLIIIFSRKQTITNVIGYLTMENGVLLFSLFVGELPLIIELLILLDLLMLIMLTTLLAFGIDSGIEEFHQKLDPFRKWFGEEK